MSDKKQIAALAGFVLSVSLLAASLTAIFLNHNQSRLHTQILGSVCQEIIKHEPSAEEAVLLTLKELKHHQVEPEAETLLDTYGYRQSDFVSSNGTSPMVFALAGFGAGAFLFLGTLLFWRKREISRIKALNRYLEQVNTGGGGILPGSGEDEFSRLQDEIYKTVTELYRTREAALRAKENFAENLSNIAHQIKTPITSILLSLQIMREDLVKISGQTGQAAADRTSGHLTMEQMEQIRHQLFRLTRLEESLLLLSRMEAGAFSLEKKDVDVFTLLELSAENLQELSRKAGVSVVVPESGEMRIRVDLEWTMEAVMNLMKNCIEHTPPQGVVSCAYEQNPLYTQIRIRDTGSGFAKEDLPHLFERFYRGKDAKNGIGIGLSLARSIIESQNGTLRAENLKEGGACFEIRFYTA